MNDLPLKIHPNSFLANLKQYVIPQNESPESILELEVSIKNKNINIREFGTYLLGIDRLYGRMQPEGIYSYSHRSSKQIKISQFREGSIRAAIAEALKNIDPNTIVILYLLLRYLPSALDDLSSVYKNYEEGRLAKIRRKEISLRIKSESLLSNLTKAQIKRLSAFLETLYESERKKLPVMIRFSKKYVIEVLLRIKRNN